jgi:hypothetical protein
VTLVNIYRPYPSSKNRLTSGLFFEEFSQFLQDYAISKGELVLVGDLNVHLDVDEDSDTRKFVALIDSLGLTQSVVGPTHQCGHTLDVVITRELDNLVKDIRVLDMISDHCLIGCTLQIERPKVPRKQITSRKYKSLDHEALKKDIESSVLITSPASDVCAAVEQYNDTLSSLLDQHAPLFTKTVVPRIQQPWFSDSLHQLKRDRRKAERRWIKSGLTVDFEIFKNARNEYNVALYNAKCSFYNSKILDCGNNFKAMFSIIGDLLHNKKPTKFPDHDCSTDIAKQFADYFMSKIVTIRSNMQSCISESAPSTSQARHRISSWTEFVPVSEEDLSEIITKSPCPSSSLDPMPSWIIKQQLNTLLPPITSLVNMSLAEGYVPASLKSAIILPLLKKSSLDHNILKNYRPVSNLPFISKVLERVVARQMNEHMSNHDLHEPLQSAYKQFHSTETALIKVHNDIMWAMETKGVTILLLLDLSSAFDTIDHHVLITRLHDLIGINDVALSWFISYLSDRTQRVCINGSFSSSQILQYGVPQGSVLGPLLFLIYTLPVGNIIRKYGMELHTYADDTQIYVSVCPTSCAGVKTAVCELEQCVSEVQLWMSSNFLKLNAEKTEVMVFGFRAQLAKFELPSIHISGVDVPVGSDPVRNLGVMFDPGMSMCAQVANITKAANFQLVNIGRARKMLTTEATQLAVHTLVTSRLDYCNSLLVGVSDTLLKRLENIQRTAARIITKKRKYDSITPELISLHWLPIRERIAFKILVLVFKSLHQQTPKYISAMLQVKPVRRQLRSTSSSSPHFTELRTQTTFGDRAFSCIAPHLWNQLPELIKSAKSVEIFKKLLKHHLFELAYNK